MSADTLIGIGLLGGLGALSRFVLDGVVSARLGRELPFGTLAVNLSGTLALGVLVGAAASDEATRLVGTGLIGGYTTFSTWALEAHRLGETGAARPRWRTSWSASCSAGRRSGRASGWERRCERRLPQADVLLRRARSRRRRVPRRCADRLLRPSRARREPGHARSRGLRREAPAPHRPAPDAVRGSTARVRRGRPAAADRGRPAGGRRAQRRWPDDPRAGADAGRSRGRAGRVHEGHRLCRSRAARRAPPGSCGDRRPAAPTRRRRRHRAAGRRRDLSRQAATGHVLRRERSRAAHDRLGRRRRAHARRPHRALRRARRPARHRRARARLQAGRSPARRAAARPGDRSIGAGVWQKLMVYCSEQSRHDGRPLYQQIVHGLRSEGAMGATAARGIWGYHGDHRPHGDTFWQLQRRVPVVTVVVDTPPAVRRWFEIIDECTDETGLVTSELVPAFHARGPGIEAGGLRLAAGWSHDAH